MSFMDLVESLFRHGLGELPVFHQRVNGAFLGNMVYDKGQLFFKDRGILGDSGVDAETLDWTENVLGMVCFKQLLQWESLTFYGLDYCGVDVVNAEMHEALSEIKDRHGERLVDFVGSVYRAFHLLLDNGYLPVVLLREMSSRNGDTGLAIADLGALDLPDAMLERAVHAIRSAVQRQTLVTLTEPG